MKKAGSVRSNLGNWIDEDNKHYHAHRDMGIQETIRAGAETVATLMAVTYLAQFRDLNGEFVQRPVYEPDFIVGFVPYSSRLIADLNHLNRKGYVVFHQSGKEVSSPIEDIEDEWYPTKLERFRRGGAQFARLYTLSKKILDQNDEQLLFDAVLRYHFRDLGLTTFARYLEPRQRAS